jgi:hypothetical protein
MRAIYTVTSAREEATPDGELRQHDHPTIWPRDRIRLRWRSRAEA